MHLYNLSHICILSDYAHCGFSNLLKKGWRTLMTALQAIIPHFILERIHRLASELWAHQST